VPDTTDYLGRIRDHARGKDPLESQKQIPLTVGGVRP